MNNLLIIISNILFLMMIIGLIYQNKLRIILILINNYQKQQIKIKIIKNLDIGLVCNNKIMIKK